MKNKTKIRVEVSSVASTHMSGVGYYTQQLTDALALYPGTTVRASYYNFLGRQPRPTFDNHVIVEENSLFPLRIYAKLQSHKLALPFDLLSKPVDLTIHTNYARWPTVRSRYVATAIYDLTFIHYPELIEKNNLPHLQRVVPRAIKSSDLLITDSEAVKTELIQSYAVSPDKIIVTPIPPSDQFFKENSADIHTRYNIPTKKYILFLGTVEPRKNLPILIEAYAKLDSALTNEYSLVIAGGSGWKSERTQLAIKTAQEKGLSVIQTGYVDNADKSALYQKASLFVMPSLYEGFGMPILEAFASHTPVIASDIPVLHEAGGQGALYFRPDSAEELKNAVVSVLGDSKLQSKMLNLATKHLKSFSWADNAKLIVDAIKMLDDSKGAT